MKFTGRRLILFAGLILLSLLGGTPGIVSAQTLEAINEHYLIEAKYDKGRHTQETNLLSRSP